MTWEVVIGIEIHVQLRTERKLFCGDRTQFGAPPNSQVCPVCLGLPGALPTTNPEAVRLAVRAAVALGCTVHERSIWTRKNYFYPDLPKGYQITQFEEPLATGGAVTYDGEQGESKVRIHRIHMEEDAGKSIHDRLPGATGVDLNRAGTPLVEIVTEPDLRCPSDVRAFLTALKHILEYAEVSDCNMEEGSLRADANISIRPHGDDQLGTKTEIKNVNSFSGIERALELEIERQISVRESGGVIHQQTLLWDDHQGTVRPMRSKEGSQDYRYFPDPDLPPLRVTNEEITVAREAVPELPRVRQERFCSQYALSEYDARVLTNSAVGADYFEAAVATLGDAKLVANWLMGPVQALINLRGETAGTFAVTPSDLGSLIGLVRDGTISDGVAKGVLQTMADDGGAPHDIVVAQGLEQVRDSGLVDGWIDAVVEECSEEVARYQEGEGRLIGFFVGRVMQRSEGKADPRQVNELLLKRLS